MAALHRSMHKSHFNELTSIGSSSTSESIPSPLAATLNPSARRTLQENEVTRECEDCQFYWMAARKHKETWTQEDIWLIMPVLYAHPIDLIHQFIHPQTKQILRIY